MAEEHKSAQDEEQQEEANDELEAVISDQVSQDNLSVEGNKTKSEEPETSEPDIEVLQQETETLRQQADENLDKALRAQAELENLRKRTLRDIENAHKFALEKFVKELLPVIDSMELGIAATDTADDPVTLKEGMDLTLKKFVDCVIKFGVTVIDPQDEKFDPEKHEAVSMAEDEQRDSGIVIQVVQKGYELNGRLVRPAMVIVAK